MYNSFMILLLGTIPFLIAGIPVGYWLNARLTEHPAAEVTYAYALFAGYVLYAVPSLYLARAGIPVRVFAWILPVGAAAGFAWFLIRMKKAGQALLDNQRQEGRQLTQNRLPVGKAKEQL